MTVRLDMRRTAGRATAALGDSVEAVKTFLRGSQTTDGGFVGRDERSDLYYTSLALEASLALGVDILYDRVAGYLGSFAAGQSLDLVHLSCLVRCWANMADHASRPIDEQQRQAAVGRLNEFRARNGGFNVVPGADAGTAYGGFLALGVWEDLGLNDPQAAALVESIRALQRLDGGFSNESSMPVGATAATAAAVVTFHYTGGPVSRSALDWLLARRTSMGGFSAIPLDPSIAIPDLLSTATALHALRLAAVPLDDLRDANLDYLDSLWSPQGAFRGHSGDEVLDCEYTYYGLLSLGNLIEP
jgi:prenyltransferase beta subunit